jgi:LysM repeat protein
MSTHSARSRRTTRENSLWRRAPKWLQWVIIGFGALLLLDVVLVGGWVARAGGFGEIKLFGDGSLKVYLPLMVSNPTADPRLALQPTRVTEAVTVQFEEYKIKAGDTLYDIALRNEISLEQLLAANPGLKTDTILQIGDVILIPPADFDLASLPSTPTRTRKPTKTPTPAQGASVATATPAAEVTESAALEASPTRKPAPVLAERVSEINGVPIEQIIVLPPVVVENMRATFADGQVQGRNAQSFAKIGDSTIESPFFMDRFDTGSYNLGKYTYLQRAINYFSGSFARQGPSVRRGMHAWTLFDPMWTDYEGCRSGESPVECEFRLQNPAFVFIRLGSNDVGRQDLFTSSMKKLVELCLKEGIIPILGTKADNLEGGDQNNQILRDLAEDYDVPLWDFEKVAQTLPNNGIGEDGVHLTIFYPHDYSLPEGLQTGYGVHTITALMMLYELWRLVART